jgi:hypothetical protein
MMSSKLSSLITNDNNIKLKKDIHNNLTTNDGYLVPINYTEGGAITDLINNTEIIMNKYKEYTKLSNKITNLLVYGNIEKPLFQVSYIYPYIHDKQKDLSHVARYMTNNNLDDPLYSIKCNIIIDYKDGKLVKSPGTTAWLFTEEGLIKALFIGKSNFCKEFHMFVVSFLKTIRRDERDAYDRSMVTAIKEQTERIALLEQKNFHNQKYINYKNQLSDAISTEDIDMLGNVESQELNIYRYLYCKKRIDVYIVNPEYLKKPIKKQKEIKKTITEFNSSDDEMFNELTKPSKETKKKQKKITQEKTLEIKDDIYLDLLEYDDDFDQYNLMNLKDIENTEFYFYLQNSNDVKKDKKNFNYINTLSFHTKEHYDTFLKKISLEEYLSPIKKVYKLTYDTIKSFKSSTFNKLHMSSIHETIKKDNKITKDFVMKYELY